MCLTALLKAPSCMRPCNVAKNFTSDKRCTFCRSALCSHERRGEARFGLPRPLASVHKGRYPSERNRATRKLTSLDASSLCLEPPRCGTARVTLGNTKTSRSASHDSFSKNVSRSWVNANPQACTEPLGMWRGKGKLDSKISCNELTSRQSCCQWGPLRTCGWWQIRGLGNSSGSCMRPPGWQLIRSY